MAVANTVALARSFDLAAHVRMWRLSFVLGLRSFDVVPGGGPMSRGVCNTCARRLPGAVSG